MQIKLLEVRDRGTFIPVMATHFEGREHPLLRVAGFDGPAVIVCRLTGGACAATYDPFCWPANPRTMREAHIVILRTWDRLKDGDVIDVEYELGETPTKKEAQ